MRNKTVASINQNFVLPDEIKSERKLHQNEMRETVKFKQELLN
jgi:hypothetical protein